MEEDINNYLDQVTLEELLQYFEDRKIPLPSDVCKKTLIHFLLDSKDHKTDARAAVLLELRNSARLLQRSIRESTDKLEKVIDDVDSRRQTLSDELKREVGGVRTLTKVHALFMVLITVATGAGGFWSVGKLKELGESASMADTNLKRVTALVDSYSAHVLRMARDDLSAVMDGASTRWFWDTDRSQTEVVASNLKMIQALRQAPGKNTAEMDAELTMMALQYEAIQHLLTVVGEAEPTAGNKIPITDFANIEKEWLELETKVQNASLAPADKSRLLSHVHNMLGITLYQRHSMWGNGQDLNSAMKRFRDAHEINPVYVPAASNLAVVLLDIIELASAKANADERLKLEREIDAPVALLMQATSGNQSMKTRSKVFNNLAYSSLQRAALRESAGDLPSALKHANAAVDWAKLGIEQSGAAGVLFATRAEIVAYKACLSAAQGVPDNIMASEALKLLKDAQGRYDFKAQNASGFFKRSPIFAKFVDSYKDKRQGVLESVGVT